MTAWKGVTAFGVGQCGIAGCGAVLLTRYRDAEHRGVCRPRLNDGRLHRRSRSDLPEAGPARPYPCRPWGIVLSPSACHRRRDPRPDLTVRGFDVAVMVLT